VTEIEKSQDEFFRNRVLLDEYRRHILEEWYVLLFGIQLISWHFSLTRLINYVEDLEKQDSVWRRRISKTRRS
jgi:hypothetical protein